LESVKHKYKFDQQAYTNHLFIWNGYYKMSHFCAELQKLKNLTASMFYICLVANQVISFVSSAGVSILSPYSATQMSVCTDFTAVLH